MHTNWEFLICFVICPIWFLITVGYFIVLFSKPIPPKTKRKTQ
jgi:hypothetical protein